MNVLIKGKMKETRDELIAKTKETTIRHTIEAIKTRVKETLENERGIRKMFEYIYFK